MSGDWSVCNAPVDLNVYSVCGDWSVVIVVTGVYAMPVVTNVVSVVTGVYTVW